MVRPTFSVGYRFQIAENRKEKEKTGRARPVARLPMQQILLSMDVLKTTERRSRQPME